MKFYALDERQVWHEAILKTAKARGFETKRVFRGEECSGPGYGFIRPHAEPKALKRNQHDWDAMSSCLTMIQDEAQVRVYEDKSEQFRRWGAWMPQTWRFTDREAAWRFVEGHAEWPLVSKADVGASSVNVRILKDAHAARSHVEQLFGNGVVVRHCAGKAMSVQRGYALLQQFIPHRITWRVNAIGRRWAIFKRYCYADRPVAQTGNVEPVMVMDDQIESLLAYSERVRAAISSRWVALDILQDGDDWRLLETSLAWPWPSPGDCNSAPIFGSGRKWIDLFEVMMDEVEAGTW